MPADARSFNRARNQLRRSLQRSPHRAHDLLRSGIRTGHFATDASLTEDALITRLATSRNSVRAALQMLASEGLVLRRPNLGTTVIGSISDVPIEEIVSHHQMAAVRAMTVRELDHREIPATEYLRARLESTCAIVDVSEVLVSADGEPRSVRVSYVPYNGEPVIRIADVIPVSVAFERVFKAPLGSCDVAVSAIPAGPSLSKLLGISEGAPVLVEEMVMRDITGTPREFSYTHHRADRITLSMTFPLRDAPGMAS
jgi:GntR family transcriptional regulator